MNFQLYSEVILLCDVPDDGLCAGNIGVIVDRHEVAGLETGFSVEFFDLMGNTVAVATLPGSFLRAPSQKDRPAIRSDVVAA